MRPAHGRGSVAIDRVRPAGAAILGDVIRITDAAILEVVIISHVRSVGAAILGVVAVSHVQSMGAAILGVVRCFTRPDGSFGRIGPVEASPARLVYDGHPGKWPHR